MCLRRSCRWLYRPRSESLKVPPQGAVRVEEVMCPAPFDVFEHYWCRLIFLACALEVSSPNANAATAEQEQHSNRAKEDDNERPGAYVWVGSIGVGANGSCLEGNDHDRWLLKKS